MPLIRYAHPRLLPAFLLASTACATEPSPSPAIRELQGEWTQVSCTIIGSLPPRRSEDCLGSAPDLLTADTIGHWTIEAGSLPGEDPGVSFAGTFARRDGRFWADYIEGGSYRIQFTHDADGMTWTAPARYTFVNQSAEEPADVEVKWARPDYTTQADVSVPD